MDDGLTRMLVDVCLNAERLEAVRDDPGAALAEMGVQPDVVRLVEQRRGSWISYAVSVSRPVPSPEDIRAYVRERAAEDAAFAEQIRVEPRPMLERAFQTRFPVGSAIEVGERDGLPEVTVTGLGGPQIVDPEQVRISAEDTDVDIDVDVDIDAVVVVDVDIDVDVDVVHEDPSSRAWAEYWNRRRRQWREADDRLLTV